MRLSNIGAVMFFEKYRNIILYNSKKNVTLQTNSDKKSRRNEGK